MAFTVGEFGRGKFGLLLRFFQVREAFLDSFRAVVVGEGELLVTRAVDAIFAQLTR